MNLKKMALLTIAGGVLMFGLTGSALAADHPAESKILDVQIKKAFH